MSTVETVRINESRHTRTYSAKEIELMIQSSLKEEAGVRSYKAAKLVVEPQVEIPEGITVTLVVDESY